MKEFEKRFYSGRHIGFHYLFLTNPKAHECSIKFLWYINNLKL